MNRLAASCPNPPWIEHLSIGGAIFGSVVAVCAAAVIGLFIFLLFS